MCVLNRQQCDLQHQHGDLECGTVWIVVMEELAAAEAAYRCDNIPDHHPCSPGTLSHTYMSASRCQVCIFSNDLGQF